MTLVFVAIGLVFFAAITHRFLTKNTSREPAASRVK